MKRAAGKVLRKQTSERHCYKDWECVGLRNEPRTPISIPTLSDHLSSSSVFVCVCTDESHVICSSASAFVDKSASCSQYSRRLANRRHALRPSHSHTPVLVDRIHLLHCPSSHFTSQVHTLPLLITITSKWDQLKTLRPMSRIFGCMSRKACSRLCRRRSTLETHCAGLDVAEIRPIAPFFVRSFICLSI